MKQLHPRVQRNYKGGWWCLGLDLLVFALASLVLLSGGSHVWFVSFFVGLASSVFQSWLQFVGWPSMSRRWDRLEPRKDQ